MKKKIIFTIFYIFIFNISSSRNINADDLFEKGYLTVSEGSVIILKRKGNSDDLNDYLNEIEGNSCSYWSGKTIPFFEWHNDFHTN